MDPQANRADVTHTVRVPGSTSNLGAGFDCLGLALDFWLEASLSRGTGPPVYEGTLRGLSPPDDLIATALGDSLQDNYRLRVRSEIPVSKGLGSSAAARVAALVLARLYAGQAIDRRDVFRLACALEEHPDNAGPAVYGGLVLNAHQPTVLQLSDMLGIALALPEQTISTEAAREILPSQLPRADAIAQASRSAALVLGLTRGDGELVRFGMVDCIAAPHRQKLIPGYDAAAAAGETAGAYGVTVSGAGSGMVAVGPIQRAGQIADAMAESLSRSGNPARASAPRVVSGGFEIVRPT